MTNEELKKKIVEVVLNSEITGIQIRAITGGYSMANNIADALIAAGIGDVKETQHSAEVAEKQVYCLARSFAEALCKNGNVENLIQGFIQDAQKQAEKELAEEKNEQV